MPHAVKLSLRSNTAQQKVLLWTLFHAHLRRRTAINGSHQIYAFREIQKHQIRFINHRTVHTTLPIHRVGGQDESFRIAVLVSVGRDHSPGHHKGGKEEQTKDVCA